MALDKATVAKIATLARIHVSEDEQSALAAELGQILSWVEQLDEVDTTGLEPMTSAVEARLFLRNDEVTDGNIREDVLANAPHAERGFYAVPKVVE